MNSQKIDHFDLAFAFGAMHGCYQAMPQEDKDALAEWENLNLGPQRDGRISTSHWPGWDKYLVDIPGLNHLRDPRRPKQPPRIGKVYFIRNQRNGYTKIGFSVSLELREKTLQSEEPDLVVIGSIRGTKKTERAIHNAFSSQRIRGEWFNLSDAEIREIIA